MCSGVDENAVGTFAELIFAPIDASFADDAPLLPSGFRIIPLDSVKVRLKLTLVSITSHYYIGNQFILTLDSCNFFTVALIIVLHCRKLLALIAHWTLPLLLRSGQLEIGVLMILMLILVVRDQ